MKLHKRLIPFCAIILLVTSLQAQQVNSSIVGKVIHKITDEPLFSVHIYLVENSQSGITTDENGAFKLAVLTFPVAIRISYVGFHEQTILLKYPPQDSLIITLRSLISELSEVIVSSKVIIDTLYNAPRSVTDYEFYENFLFLLAYKNSFKKYSLLVLDEEDNVLTDYSLKDLRPLSLFKSCLDKVFLVCEKFAYELQSDGKNLHLKNKTSTLLFEEKVKPCVSASDNFLYFSEYYFQGQALQYQVVPKIEKGFPKRLPIIQNEDNIDLLIEETGLRFPRSGNVWQKKSIGKF